MKINRSDNPDFSLIRFWLRREVYLSSEFRNWVYKKLFEAPLKLRNPL